MSNKSNVKYKIESWIDNRYNTSSIKDLIQNKKVPQHKYSFIYYLGGVTLFLFIVQLITGILLLLYYSPGEDTAYESVRYIIQHVNFGWLIRNVHSWSANLMVFFAFAHMFSVYFTKAYKNPRELTWVTGIFLLLIIMTFGFSGYLLPWNELAFFATKVGTDIVSAVPFIGEELRLILRGSEDVTGATLTRFFGLHVAILPVFFTFFLILHLGFVQKQGMHEPEKFKSLPDKFKKFIPFFPDFALRDILLWLIVFNILLILALFSPWELGLKADPFTPAPEGIKPEWYFLFMFQTLKELPSHILFIEGETFGILLFTIGGLIWLLMPFINFKKKEKGIQTDTLIGIFVLSFIVVMTFISFFS